MTNYKAAFDESVFGLEPLPVVEYRIELHSSPLRPHMGDL